MAVATQQKDEWSETTHLTKRVFMRAEHDDVIEFSDTIAKYCNKNVPDVATVVKRDLTYYGPRLRIEADGDGEQYLLTAPGPETQAILWSQTGREWKKIAEVCINFDGSPPQYDICLYCNEPLSSSAHRRRSVIGACEN